MLFSRRQFETCEENCQYETERGGDAGSDMSAREGFRSHLISDHGQQRTSSEGLNERPFDLTDLVISAGAKYAASYPVTQPASLSAAIERAIATDGFTFVEALSPCPTHLVRQGTQGVTIESVYDDLEARCITVKQAEALGEDEIKGRFVIGEFTR